MTRKLSLTRHRLIIVIIFISHLMASSFLWAKQPAMPIEGILEIRAATYLDQKPDRLKRDAIQYVLKTQDNHVYSLRFADPVPVTLKTGQRVKILRGVSLSENASKTPEIELTSNDIVIVQDISRPEFAGTIGDQRTLVILVNYQDNPSDKPWTIADVRNVVYTTMGNMLNEFSYKQTTVSGDVVGWYTIALSRDASCGSIQNTLPSLADEAARNAGVDLSKFDRRIYMFPQNSNCQWAGLGTVGGWPSRAWLNGINRVEVTAHEVGHNLGLYHSHSLECTGSPNEGECKSIEYGDYADTMGFPYVYAGPHFNAPQKERIGWLNKDKSPPIQMVTESGSYFIDTYETVNNKPKALKILKNKLSNQTSEYYYLEFRQGIGFDKKLAECRDCDFTSGVIVHQANPSYPDSSYILDMTPNDGSRSKMMTLHPGESFTDKNAAEKGVTITVDSISESGAVVNIKFGNTPPPECRHFNPTLTVFPNGTNDVKPGETAFYNFTLWNNDDAICPVSNFEISAVADNRIGVSIQSRFLSLKPGERRDFFVSATARLSLPVGVYGISVMAQSLLDPNYFTSNVARLGVR